MPWRRNDADEQTNKDAPSFPAIRRSYTTTLQFVARPLTGDAIRCNNCNKKALLRWAVLKKITVLPVSDIGAEFFNARLPRPYGPHDSMRHNCIVKHFVALESFCALYALYPKGNTPLHISWLIVAADLYSDLFY